MEDQSLIERPRPNVKIGAAELSSRLAAEAPGRSSSRAIGFRDFACADPAAISTGSGFEEKMDTLARPIAGISCF